MKLLRRAIITLAFVLCGVMGVLSVAAFVQHNIDNGVIAGSLACFMTGTTLEAYQRMFKDED